jgi:hypothetical protein
VRPIGLSKRQAKQMNKTTTAREEERQKDRQKKNTQKNIQRDEKKNFIYLSFLSRPTGLSDSTILTLILTRLSTFSTFSQRFLIVFSTFLSIILADCNLQCFSLKIKL